ncbi:hypothetical protein CVT26_015305 [Gymnopilus dilepis]|uniref:Kinesin light chain n=1 Tax=Gymnopilus dilepis TaxID=231916 RepID=A0A409X9T8_9AGAR|nr:hypothetical protein CVT26_015305 [Gymnopilus dilepis]
MGNLARTYSDQGRLDEAEKLEVQVLDSRKRLLGDKHPDTLLSMGNLAATHRDLDRWQEAEDLATRCFFLRVKVLGKQHPKTLVALNRLVMIYEHNGKPEAAEVLKEGGTLKDASVV